jgi:hypothetical protein
MSLETTCRCVCAKDDTQGRNPLLTRSMLDNWKSSEFERTGPSSASDDSTQYSDTMTRGGRPTAFTNVWVDRRGSQRGDQRMECSPSDLIKRTNFGVPTECERAEGYSAGRIRRRRLHALVKCTKQVYGELMESGRLLSTPAACV